MSSAPEPSAWRIVEGGLQLAVRATPRGGRDAIEGLRRDAAGECWLAARVSVAAEGGGANAALLALVARALGVRRADVTLVSGAAARLKRLRITGDPALLAARLEQLVKERT